MRPSREQGQNRDTSYFVSTQTARRQPFFRHERWANLLSETIVHYDNIGYCLHAYVIMPDHVHLLVTPADSLEKAVQHFKGGFSFRARKEFAWKADIWQPGFTDHRIRDDEDWNRHIEYIRTNPIRARLAVGYPYVGFPSPNFPQGLKPRRLVEEQDVRAEARTLHAEAGTLHAEGRTLHAEAGTLHAEAGTLHAEAGTLRGEGSWLDAKFKGVYR
jgi:putative transposase